MTRLIAAVLCLFALSLSTSSAQPLPTNAAGVTMGHWHLNMRDPDGARKIFVAMGGKAVKAGQADVVEFPGVVIRFMNPGTPAPKGGTEGSVINHVGFMVKDVPSTFTKWKAAGVPVVPGNNGRKDQLYVNMPDGLRIEILEDKTQAMPIRNEHVHFSVTEAEIPKIQAWYAKTFGGKAYNRTSDKAPVVDIPGVQLRFAKADAAAPTTKERVLDHIGFDVKNLQAFLKKFEADGGKIARPYTKNEQANTALAFIYDPWGTYIELNERPTTI
jgi:catechol 2,3-dioxygenase-like lactoylglutathione lyase family enzyme